MSAAPERDDAQVLKRYIERFDPDRPPEQVFDHFREVHGVTAEPVPVNRDMAEAALARLVAVEKTLRDLKADLHKHADAIDGYDGTLLEHGPCLVCDVLDEEPPAAGEGPR